MKPHVHRPLSLAVAFAAFVCTGCDDREYPSPALEAKVEASAPAFRSASDNLAASGVAFVGQIVEISGTIEHITNKGGAPAIILTGGVICGFGKKQRAMVSTLNKGDRITLRGIYDSAPNGSVGPFLTPCVRIP